jgi:hypothetical protein
MVTEKDRCAPGPAGLKASRPCHLVSRVRGANAVRRVIPVTMGDGLQGERSAGAVRKANMD